MTLNAHTGCKDCGSPAEGARCTDCQMLQRTSDDDPIGGPVVGDDGGNDADRIAYECCACGATYRAAGLSAAECPDCGSARCRAAPEEVSA